MAAKSPDKKVKARVSTLETSIEALQVRLNRELGSLRPDRVQTTGKKPRPQMTAIMARERAIEGGPGSPSFDSVAFLRTLR